MKLSTINLIVESILEDAENPSEKQRVMPIAKQRVIPIANEATIYLKTALICELQGIDKAMEYFHGNHTMDEYKEFRTEVMLGGERGKR